MPYIVNLDSAMTACPCKGIIITDTQQQTIIIVGIHQREIKKYINSCLPYGSQYSRKSKRISQSSIIIIIFRIHYNEFQRKSIIIIIKFTKSHVIT